MKNFIVLLLLPLFIPLDLNAQTAPPDSLGGIAMREWLKTNWYDDYHNTLSYSAAREKMYAYIDNKDDNVTCVYSGYQKSHAYGTPGTGVSPINCEHTVPQSFFNEASPMKTDIHHLFPTYGNWNSARSNYPFADIPDNETVNWMCGLVAQQTIPTTNIDDCSENNVISGDWSNPNNRFEPREDHKGNLARAVFYFYTMYPTQGGTISNVATLETLCTWNRQDTVDARERQRNDDTEQYQGNRNPYIDYPELDRIWGCNIILTSVQEQKKKGKFKVYPNPFSQTALLEFVGEAGEIALSVYDLQGRRVGEQHQFHQGRSTINLELSNLSEGLYFVKLIHKGIVYQTKIVKAF